MGPIRGLSLLVMVAAWCCIPLLALARTRTYYIAAVEEEWDYAPEGNLVNDDNATSDRYLRRSADRIGSVYLKAMYRQYTDGTFTMRAPRPDYLGLLGPIIRAEQGDTIKIVFKNLAYLSARNFSIHPHGVLYGKNMEGALYVDATTGTDKQDDGVPPGGVFTYVWTLPAAFAPTQEDEPCLPWAYHSHTSPVRDVDTGLVGLMTTCKRGTLDGERRKDVDYEYPLYVDATDEGDSWLLPLNLNRCGSLSTCQALDAAQNAAFVESNLKRHINGRMYGNLQGLRASQGRRAVFYFFNLDRDVHSLHFSGQVLTVRGQRMDSVQVVPASFVAAYMTPVYSGRWLLASRVTESFAGGQLAYLTVGTSAGRSRRQAEEAAIVAEAAASLNMTEENLLEARNASQSQGAASGARHLAQDVMTERLAAEVQEALKHDGQIAYRPPNPMPSRWVGRRWWSRRRGSGTGGRPSRQFYLGIEDYEWDYGPSGLDKFNGGSLTAPGSNAAPYFTRGPNRIGGKYRKSRFVQYTDATFRTRMSRDASQEHLGMLGPVLEMEVGETVTVTLRNLASRPYSFFPHGLLFDKSEEGFVYMNRSGVMEGAVVTPNQTEDYTFRVPALGEKDNPCIVSTYQSAVDPIRDVNTGLIGPLLMCNRGQLVGRHAGGRWESRSWYGQHKHLFLSFLTVDENLSWHLKDNVKTYTTSPDTVNLGDAGFYGANRKHSINGRMFGNLEGLEVCRGERVAWHLLGAGDRLNVHGANFHGQALDLAGNHLNAKVLVPGTALTLTSVPDALGQWAILCRTNFHLQTGMVAEYQVENCPGSGYQNQESAQYRRDTIRTYFIAAEEVYHDYAPLKRDPVTGDNFTNPAQVGYLFVRNDSGYIGTVYKKARYIRYTDATFRTRYPQGPEDEHLGLLGPVLAAEVGDVIRVTFYNKASRPYSIHPQGVRYDKNHEGARYEDGASPSAGDAVQPGETFVYEWTVPPSAGPGPSDPSCVPWMYYSSVDSVKDMLSGLMGPLLVCRPGILVSTQSRYGKLRRKDVQREFWMLYFVIDENGSWYIDNNTAEFAPDRYRMGKDASFTQSNVMNSINGKIFANVPGLVMDEGDTVAWYVLGLGSTFDYHPVHFHGQTFIHQVAHAHHRGDVLEVFPSTSSTVTMVCDNPGVWIIHCHFSTHAASGMEALYTIRPRQASYGR